MRVWRKALMRTAYGAAVVRLVALTVLLSALIPAGFMPSLVTGQDGAGRVSVVICTGDGLKTVPFESIFEGDPSDPRIPTGEHDPHDGVCAFAWASNTVAVEAPILAAVLSQPLMKRAEGVQQAFMLVHRATGPADRSRAPPVSA